MKPQIFKSIQHQRVKSEHGYVDKLATVDDFEVKEIYVTNVGRGLVSAWKRHRLMTSNLKVVAGEVLFVFPSSTSKFDEVVLHHRDELILRIEPGTWFGFQGLLSHNSIINMASMVHVSEEIERAHLENYPYSWRKS